MTQLFEGIQRIALTDLLPNPYQPEGRLVVKPEKAREFALSFQKSGMHQMPIARHSRAVDGKYEVGDGWQRRAGAEYAFRELGIMEYETIACVVKNLTDQEMADMIIETTDIRRDMNVIERAQYYRKYFEKFPHITQAEFATRHNRSQGEIANTLRLLELPDDIQNLIISQEITETHGRSLLQLKNREKIIEMAGWIISEHLTVKELDEAVKKYLDTIKPKMEMTQAPKAEKTEALNEAGEEPVRELERVDLPETELVKTSPAEQPKIETGERPVALTPEKPVVTSPPEPVKTQAPKPQNTQATSETKPAAKPQTPAPITPAPVKAKWGRKLVIEEKDDYCLASCMKAGGFPVAKRFDGDFRHAVAVALQWVEELEEQWSKEEKK